jgi:hypothetical protein
MESTDFVMLALSVASQDKIAFQFSIYSSRLEPRSTLVRMAMSGVRGMGPSLLRDGSRCSGRRFQRRSWSPRIWTGLKIPEPHISPCTDLLHG